MALDKQHGKYIIVCDKCLEVLETNKRDFHEALDVAREEGWNFKKDGMEWEHFCPKDG